MSMNQKAMPMPSPPSSQQMNRLRCFPMDCIEAPGLYDEAILATYKNLIKTKADATVYVNLGNMYIWAE